MAPVPDKFMAKKLNGKYLPLPERTSLIKRAVSGEDGRWSWIVAEGSGLTTKGLLEKIKQEVDRDVIVMKVVVF